MKINQAYTMTTLEAAVSGYDTKDLCIISDKNELTVSFFPHYVFVTETLNLRTHSDEFPRKNWNKNLWKLVWARFRTHCKEERE